MAEEGTLGLGRATSNEDDDEELSKQELQRRMEEARESITQTVTEIKETVTNQYYSMKETVSDALDWRHHFRNNPIAFSVGALSVGFLVGYGLAGALKGGGHAEDADYPSPEESDVFARTGAAPQRYEEAARHSAFHGHSYAAQPITDRPHGAAEDQEGRGQSYQAEAEALPKGPEYVYSPPRRQEAEEEPEEEETDNKPSLLQRFKETSAYDRLQSEVASLGDRFMEELSTTAQTVVLPALFNKIRELFGVDLSDKQGQGQQAARVQGTANNPQRSAGGSAQGGESARAAGAASSLADASRGGSSSYATSENRGYGNEAARQNHDDSVLDLDR